DPQTALAALLALVRVSTSCPHHHPSNDPKADLALQYNVLDALERLNWKTLTSQQQLDLLRLYHVLFNRTPKPGEAYRPKLLSRLDPQFRSPNRLVNAELCQLLVYLESPTVAAKTVKLMADAPTQEEQMEYARALRVLKTGWTPELRKAYFSWFLTAAHYKGGASFGGFVANIKN